MDTQNQIHQYLNKLTRDFHPHGDSQINHFLEHLGENILKDLDVYCFFCKSGELLKKFGANGVSLSMIHPLPNSNRAMNIGLIRTSGGDCNTYNISVGTFNLIKTAGDPVDLSAVRMEKIILDVVAGETLEFIRWHGMYREYRNIFQKSYTEKTGSGLWKFLTDFLPETKTQRAARKILHDLKNLENILLWLIDNPQLNGFRHHQAFNY